MVPFKRYSAQIVEAAIAGVTEWLPCYDSTIQGFRQWFVSFSAQFLDLFPEDPCAEGTLDIVSSLQRIKALSGRLTGWLAWAVEIMANENNWRKSTQLLC